MPDAVEPAASLREHILPVICPRIREVLSRVAAERLATVEEIRIGIKRPVTLVRDRGDDFLAQDGRLIADPRLSLHASREDVERTIQLASGSSLYALEEQLRQGFLTLRGGHRVGLAGRVLLDDDGTPERLKEIAALNLRVAREVRGAARGLIPHVFSNRDRPDRPLLRNTLIFGPPRSGKTTVLRDLIREVSNGVLGHRRGLRVALVDERSELAGCYRGVPQRDVGQRTDVLDACPKAVGMMMMLRAMGPEVVATDEIGRAEDATAVEEALHGGVRVVTTAHAGSLERLHNRPALARLLQLQAFERMVRLGRSRGPGTVEQIFDGRGRLLEGREAKRASG